MVSSLLLRLYRAIVIDRPVVALGLVFIPVVFFASFVPDLKLDASAESIILEHDEALKYYRASRDLRL